MIELGMLTPEPSGVPGVAAQSRQDVEARTLRLLTEAAIIKIFKEDPYTEHDPKQLQRLIA